LMADLRAPRTAERSDAKMAANWACRRAGQKVFLLAAGRAATKVEQWALLMAGPLVVSLAATKALRRVEH